MKTINAILYLMIVFCLTNCKKKETNTPPANQSNPTQSETPVIGSSYQGGIVAYVLQSGDQGYNSNSTHGFIVTPNNIGTSLRWYNGVFIATGSSDTIVGSGQANTTTIISNQGMGNYVAKVCDTLSLNGYTDWYLPSKHELNKLYVNRMAISGFTNGFYWSSSETTSSATHRVWVQNLTTGEQYDGYKDINFYYVRAIRNF